MASPWPEAKAWTTGPKDIFDQMLQIAPPTIGLLGQSILISTVPNVPLCTAEWKKNIKLLVAPESLRATFVQIANAGAKVLMTAHDRMAKLELQTSTLPERLAAVWSLLNKGSKDEIMTIVPHDSDEVASTSSNCERYVKEALDEFHFMHSLLFEAIHLIAAAQVRSHDEAEKAKVQGEMGKNLPVLHADPAKSEEFKDPEKRCELQMQIQEANKKEYMELLEKIGKFQVNEKNFKLYIENIEKGLLTTFTWYYVK